MGLLNSIKMAFKAKKIEKQQSELKSSNTPMANVPAVIENIRLGGYASVDTFKIKLGDFLFEANSAASSIEAYGVIDLGEGEKLHRYYLYNDHFIQVMTHNDDIIEIMYFSYDHSDSLTESFVRNFFDIPEQQFNKSLEYRDKTFESKMVELGANGQEVIRPIHMSENVTKRTSDGFETYTVEHFMQLYRRNVQGNINEDEYLIQGVEEYEDNSHMMVYALGINVIEKDITIS